MRHSFDISNLSVFVDETGQTIACGEPEMLMLRNCPANSLCGFVSTVVEAAGLPTSRPAAKEIKSLEYRNGKLTVEFRDYPREISSYLNRIISTLESASDAQSQCRSIPIAVLKTVKGILDELSPP